MKVGFTGTQIGMTDKQKETVSRLLHSVGVKEVHHGDCIGADADFHDICRGIANVIVVGHPPTDHKKRAFKTFDHERPKKEYLSRNLDIVRECDILFATPKSKQEELRSGTWSTIRKARKAGKHVVLILPDGSIVNERN